MILSSRDTIKNICDILDFRICYMWIVHIYMWIKKTLHYTTFCHLTKVRKIVGNLQVSTRYKFKRFPIFIAFDRYINGDSFETVQICVEPDNKRLQLMTCSAAGEKFLGYTTVYTKKLYLFEAPQAKKFWGQKMAWVPPPPCFSRIWNKGGT